MQNMKILLLLLDKKLHICKYVHIFIAHESFIICIVMFFVKKITMKVRKFIYAITYLFFNLYLL